MRTILKSCNKVSFTRIRRVIIEFLIRYRTDVALTCLSLFLTTPFLQVMLMPSLTAMAFPDNVEATFAFKSERQRGAGWSVYDPEKHFGKVRVVFLPNLPTFPALRELPTFPTFQGLAHGCEDSGSKRGWKV